jgi:diguanylate cyclase (GGDEF)-like protein/PAS domain S-box-containing protein
MSRRFPPHAVTWPVLLALGAVATVSYSLVPPGWLGQKGLFAGVLALATWAALSGRRRARRDERSAWLVASIALGGLLVGDLIGSYGQVSELGRYSVVDDVIYVPSCIALAIAAALLGSARKGDRDRTALLDAGILSAAVAVVAWNLVAERYFGDPTLTPTARVVACAHTLLAILVIGLALRLVLSRDGRDLSTVAFASGATLVVAMHLLSAGLDDPASVQAGSPASPVWLFSFLLIGFAALLPSDVPAIHQGAAIGRTRLLVVLAAVFVPDVVLARDLSERDLLGFDTPTVVVVVSILLIALTAVRIMRSLEARLSALFFHSTDAIFLVDGDGRIAFASPSAAELGLAGASLLDPFVESDREGVARQLGNLVAMPRGSTVPLQGRVRTADGDVRVLEGVGRNLLEDENVRALVVTMRDTTQRHQLERQLQRRAFQDGLTGLANRALFVDRLEHAIKRTARQPDVGVAVLFIDLDDFKAVNDGMGHSAGDEVIRTVAERIRVSVRAADTVARLGGDEFTVLVEGTPSAAEVTALARRLLEVLQEPIDVAGVSLTVPASVGVTFATHESTAESLLRDADIAMYSAKSEGKARVTVFDAALRDDAVHRLALKVELPEALRLEQFRLAYQIIVDAQTKDMRGFEALIRWQHPVRGLVPPAEFIPAAEETGAIVDIGRWALEEACRQAVLWNRKWSEPLSINVNVSALQLHQPTFNEQLRDVLARTGLDPSLLVLELTESVLVRQHRVETILEELRAIGVGIAIDDFGTGYSSLSYLQRFPVTCLKVDKSFVADLAPGRKAGLVQSILSIGDAFGLTTVAEGVEQPEQLDLLAQLGCHRAQGFLLGKPLWPGEIDGTLEIKRMARTASIVAA